MAGDEKHQRELIDRLRSAYRSLDGVVVVSPRLLAEAADALEAALPGDDDWEYIWTRMRNPWFQEVSSVQDPHEFMRRFAALGVESGKIERRVKAGPWQPWEPVEEVSR